MQRERKIDLFDNLGKHGKLRRVGEVVEEAEKQKRGEKYNKIITLQWQCWKWKDFLMKLVK